MAVSRPRPDCASTKALAVASFSVILVSAPSASLSVISLGQLQAELDQLAVLFLPDLSNLDAVENKAVGLLAAERQAHIADHRNQRVAVAPEIVGIRGCPSDDAVRARAEPADKRIDLRLEAVEIRIRRNSGRGHCASGGKGDGSVSEAALQNWWI